MTVLDLSGDFFEKGLQNAFLRLKHYYENN